MYYIHMLDVMCLTEEYGFSLDSRYFSGECVLDKNNVLCKKTDDFFGKGIRLSLQQALELALIPVEARSAYINSLVTISDEPRKF